MPQPALKQAAHGLRRNRQRRQLPWVAFAVDSGRGDFPWNRWSFLRPDAPEKIIAVIIALVVTGKDNGADFEARLTDILSKLAASRSKDIDTRLPRRGKPKRG